MTTQFKPIEEPADNSGRAETGGLMADLRGGGGDGAVGLTDLAGAAKPQRRLSVQTLIIALTITASAGALFMMRQQGKGSGITFQNVKLDIEPDQVAQNRAAQDKILQDLARSTAAHTSADKLDKNPFVLESAGPGEAPVTAATVDTEAERIRSILSSLDVNAIMQGPTPVARINGRLVRAGDMIEGILMVAQINDRSVDLFAYGKTYTVNMGEGTTPRPNQPPRPPAGFNPNRR